MKTMFEVQYESVTSTGTRNRKRRVSRAALANLAPGQKVWISRVDPARRPGVDYFIERTPLGVDPGYDYTDDVLSGAKNPPRRGRTFRGQAQDWASMPVGPERVHRSFPAAVRAAVRFLMRRG